MEHNFEITSIIYNKEIAIKLEEQFIKDIDKCISLPDQMGEENYKKSGKGVICKAF